MGWSLFGSGNGFILKVYHAGMRTKLVRCCFTYDSCVYDLLLAATVYPSYPLFWKKNEPVPCLKASVRLLRHIFTTATDIPEFQRQLAAPSVPKFSLALIGLADKCEDQETRVRTPYFVSPLPLNLTIAPRLKHTHKTSFRVSNSTQVVAVRFIFSRYAFLERICANPRV